MEYFDFKSIHSALYKLFWINWAKFYVGQHPYKLIYIFLKQLEIIKPRQFRKIENAATFF